MTPPSENLRLNQYPRQSSSIDGSPTPYSLMSGSLAASQVKIDVEKK